MVFPAYLLASIEGLQGLPQGTLKNQELLTNIKAELRDSYRKETRKDDTKRKYKEGEDEYRKKKLVSHRCSKPDETDIKTVSSKPDETDIKTVIKFP